MKKPSPQMCHSEPREPERSGAASRSVAGGIPHHSYCINRVRFLLTSLVEMTQKWNSRKCAAFSLIELLVSVGIFVVVSAFLLANFRSGREADALRNAAVTLAANIQRMQSLALAGSSADGNAVAFGVHLVKGTSTYILFGDRSTAQPPVAADGKYAAGEEITNGTITLPSGVIISDMSPADKANTTDVLFMLPRASVVISPSPTPSSAPEARIKLKHENTTGTKTVTVNRVSGQVSVE